MELSHESISHLNLNIDIHNFSLANVFFLYTKRNIIMDGNFTKIIYSNHFFSMNSIFIYLPIELSSIEQVLNKKFIKFNQSIPKNASLIQDISKIETRILDYFKIYSNINVRNSNLLSKQLNTGNIKIYQEYSYSSDNTFNSRNVSIDSEFVRRSKISANNFVDGRFAEPSGTFGSNLDRSKIGSNLDRSKIGLERSGIANHRFSGESSQRELSQENDDRTRSELLVDTSEQDRTEFVIKVSGIWENYEEIGLTYKILEQRIIPR